MSDGRRKFEICVAPSHKCSGMENKMNGQEEWHNSPIGVFDSGVGGLTVAREIMRQLPNERIVYFGDISYDSGQFLFCHWRDSGSSALWA